LKAYSLSSRLTWRIFASAFALILLCWGSFFYLLEQTFARFDRNEVNDRLFTISELLRAEPAKPLRLIRRIENEWAARTYDRVYARVLADDGRLIAATPGMSGEQGVLFADLVPAGAGEGRPLVRKGLEGRVYWIGSLELPLQIDGRSHVFLAQIALERTNEDAVLRRFLFFFPFLLFFGAIASLWLGKWSVKMALEPVRRISDTAKGVNSATLGFRINPSDFPLEFLELAQKFNEMLERIEGGFDRLSRFSADMAHELRTPVQVLMGTFEVALARKRTSEEYETILVSGIDECERLKKIIEALLFIARCSDPGQQLKKERFELQEELSGILSFYEALAQEEKITLRLVMNGSILLEAERTLFQRGIGNLLSNSIRYSPTGSEILIRVEQVPGGVRVQVLDQGPGIPTEAQERIGDRFFRIESSRSKSAGGTGLGLSIVKGIMEAHRGKMEIESAPGRGTAVTLFFPDSAVQITKT
jgi:two-component system, OmpR family, heavy metal sensor histidine kinase CusS